MPGGDIGLVFSAAFVGSLGLTVIIAGWGDRIGRRRLLMAGSALMVTAALVPLVSREPLLLALIALSGMVAVNANESTGLQTVDQALLAAVSHGPRAHRRLCGLQRRGLGRGGGRSPVGWACCR